MDKVNMPAATGADDPEIEPAESGSMAPPTDEAIAPSEAQDLGDKPSTDQASGWDAGPAASSTGESATDASQPTTTSGEVELDQWQRRVLPFMIVMISVLAGFFLVASALQLLFLHQQIAYAPESAVGSTESQAQDTGQTDEDADQAEVVLLGWDREVLSSSGQSVPAYAFEALALLEFRTIQRRYHQANVLLMSQVWVRYLGFVTGMILALLGATFILGKMREPPVQVGGKIGALLQLTFAGTSPGIFLALVGVALMVATVVTKRELSVRDVPVYVNTGALQALAPESSSSHLSVDCREAHKVLDDLIVLYGDERLEQGDPEFTQKQNELIERLKRVTGRSTWEAEKSTCPGAMEKLIVVDRISPGPPPDTTATPQEG